MFAPRARVRRRPASRHPTPSSRRRDRDSSPLASARPAVIQTYRGSGADAERRSRRRRSGRRARTRARREASRARDVRASSSRAASAGLKLADAEQPPPRRYHHANCLTWRMRTRGLRDATTTPNLDVAHAHTRLCATLPPRQFLYVAHAHTRLARRYHHANFFTWRIRTRGLRDATAKRTEAAALTPSARESSPP